MRKSLMKKGKILAVAMGILLIAGCGSTKELIEALVSMTGTWQIVETITEASGVCAGSIGDVDTYTIEVDQDGNDLTVTVGNDGGQAAGEVFTGTVSGDEVDWTGSFPSDGGITTVKSTDITASNTSLNGTANWEWTDGSDTCTGKTQIAGTKISQ
jgi:hypothetical protein